MNNAKSILILAVSLPILISGCGGETSLTGELEMVPGLCFLHVHVGRDMDLDLVPAIAGTYVPMWLCDSLQSRGDFGVSLMGINITDFTPQLLFLSRKVGTDEMVEIGRGGFGCTYEEKDYGYDLLDGRGSIIGSVAGRNGWTCLMTGSNAGRSASSWLDIDVSQSLAADTDLVSISGSDADLTVLISHNTIGFLSVIPTGMLSREEISMLISARDLISALEARALKIGLEIVENDGCGALDVSVELVRSGGNITSLTLGFSDTGFPPDSLIGVLTGLLETEGRR